MPQRAPAAQAPRQRGHRVAHCADNWDCQLNRPVAHFNLVIGEAAAAERSAVHFEVSEEKLRVLRHGASVSPSFCPVNAALAATVCPFSAELKQARALMETVE